MADIASSAIQAAKSILLGNHGLAWAAAQAGARTGEEIADVDSDQIVCQNVGADVAEKSRRVVYPAVYVYCEKVENILREKFRTASGKARVIFEIRVSQDRLDGIERQLQLQADAITDVLDAHRGTWSNGFYFAGAYEVSYAPVKSGGSNYLQCAKVAVDVEFSK